jgi:hypothetical protein
MTVRETVCLDEHGFAGNALGRKAASVHFREEPIHHGTHAALRDWHCAASRTRVQLLRSVGLDARALAPSLSHVLPNEALWWQAAVC